MYSRNIVLTAGVGVLGAAMLALIGCGGRPTPGPEARKQAFSASRDDAVAPTTANSTTGMAVKPTEGDHAHKPGSHGGVIVPIGTDSYHAESVIEKGGAFRLLMLGKDESRIQEVDEQPIKAYVKVVGQSDTTPVELASTPQDGDASGKTSQFVGLLPEEFRGQPLEVTIPNIRINGERFRIGFTTQTAPHQEEMPSGLPAAEEEALYLTPGGKYTEADIKANGKMTAAQKFKGVLSSHDMKPKPGDRICPVTLTKANPKFTWVIDGKPYQFCCPPCVDEFVKTAKLQPEEVKVPDSYIK